MDYILHFILAPFLCLAVTAERVPFIPASVKQSSTYAGLDVGLSIDGDDSTFSMTGFQFDTWWTGTLQRECPVRAVEIHGEHAPILILAGMHKNQHGFMKPSLENPVCRLLDYSTELGQPDRETFECDVVRNATNIDIVSALRTDHSLLMHEVVAHCA